MEFSEKWGTDVETAVNLALAELKVTRDEVDVTVLEEPSRGFFGIGSKLALVRVEKKKKAEEPAAAPEPELVVKTEEKKEVKKEHKKPRTESRRESKVEKRERPERKSSVEREAGELFPVEEHAALEFLKEVTEQMGLEIEIAARANKDNVFINIQGKDSGTIIGKRGQTLDAIQYLTSLVVNKDEDDYIRVVVDAENYRAKREKTLEKLANRLADKVIKTKRSVRLEPMNPYERKVIHATLQHNSRVTTRSEGQDPYRRVIIELK
ncbi:MAG: RNA-binding cell elongation regulator Jag/EloR [Lachnospiraceae bacterium]|nr:RNA-binding cell elongation regulator Jag/EloR [Lachnospiraceae bacterium]